MRASFDADILLGVTLLTEGDGAVSKVYPGTGRQNSARCMFGKLWAKESGG